MRAMKDTIHFLMTGGTIDSYYEGTKDTVVPNKHSIIPEYIKSLKLQELIEFTEVCMKDSRDLNLNDLQKISKTVEQSTSSKIIITQGTYTMPDTARYLKANLKRKGQTLILTGAMIPLQGFSPSDASFNLGYSIAKLEVLNPGVYLCMNGQVFAPEEVSKLISEGRFVSIFGEK